MSQKYLLRVEAVNLFANLIDDTDDLSTRRGGGLLALHAIGQLLSNVGDRAFRKRLQPVATGASVGLYSFAADDDEDARAVRDMVRDHFRTDSLEYADEGKTEHIPLKVGTFVVDVEPETGSADEADEVVQRLVARNRWRQMSELSIAEAGLWNPAERECELDCVRPAVGDILKGDKLVPASLTVQTRRAYGRQMKQKLHSKAVPGDWAFTNEFSEIADAKSLDPEMIDPITHEPVRKLRPTHDKLAVLYLDGNGFGKLGRQRLKEGLEKFTTWSEGIQSHHNGLLERILDAATRDKEWMNYDKVRLETLLWGGDEIIWVVPAWKGWELVKLVFASAHAINERPVSYSAGLVFCHVKSPIKDIVELAIRLGNTAKAACKDDDRLAYEVLESLDTITSNLDTHRRVWLPGEIRTSESVITPAVDADVLLLDPKQLASAWEHLNALAQSDDLPRRQLYGYCRAWKNHDSAEMARAESRIRQALPNAGLESSLASLGGGPGAWLHLLQILPYLPTAARS